MKKMRFVVPTAKQYFFFLSSRFTNDSRVNSMYPVTSVSYMERESAYKERDGENARYERHSPQWPLVVNKATRNGQ